MSYTAEEALLVEEERAIDQVAQCESDLLQARRNLAGAKAYREACRKTVLDWQRSEKCRQYASDPVGADGGSTGRES